MAVLHVAIDGKPFEEGFHQTLPKTINFSPDGALHEKCENQYYYWERPIRGKILLKVFGKGVRGDSPQCGEMSEGQRGQAPVWWNLSSERFFPDKYV